MMMRKVIGCFGIGCMFAGIVWGMFDHAWLALVIAGGIIAYLAAHWEDT